MKILVLSGYHAASHDYWLQGLLDHFPEHQWTPLTLPPRHFKWRIRSNSLLWGFGEQKTLSRDYDLLIATSMVDLSALRGFIPSLSRIPTLVYFHENQFAYPSSGSEQRPSVEPPLINCYTALCADRIVFNSRYNLDSFLAGTRHLLHKMPDEVPEGIMPHLERRASVLSVPLNDECFQTSDNKSDKFSLIWNHRWEYDKGPEGLLACLEALPAALPLRVHVVGQSFRQQPAAFMAIEKLLHERQWRGLWGYLENREDYQQLLRESHCVLSTSLHDFQGLSMLEASAAGCTPVLPDRLAYRDFFPEQFRYLSDLSNPQAEARAAAEMIKTVWKQWRDGQRPTTIPSQLSWPAMRPKYQALFEALTKKTAD